MSEVTVLVAAVAGGALGGMSLRWLGYVVRLGYRPK